MSKEAKHNILEKGTELIYKKGYHSVGLKQILDTAGIPKGSFYYYFKSKEDFGLQVIDFYSKNAIEFLKTYLENSELKPKARIIDLLHSMKSIYEEQNFSQGCLLGNCSLELGAQKRTFASSVSKNFNRWQDLFAKTIVEGQESGDISKEMSADHLASFIINSWEGALVRMKSSRSNEPMDLFIQVINRIL